MQENRKKNQSDEESIRISDFQESRDRMAVGVNLNFQSVTGSANEGDH